jgi:ATP-binding cassette, subfamily G (WHITE), eye pigment precursor transporter
VSGIAKPGEILAILGSSGSGKTTLLNAINFRNRGTLTINGEVKVNGELISTNEQISAISGYVQQTDLFYSTLTVKEHLTFAAMLKMHKSYGLDKRHNRVLEVLNDVNIRKNCGKAFF